jgi:hypothetical protein
MVKKALGLTTLAATDAAEGLTAADVPQLTPQKATRRYKPRARKCANKACGKVFTPQAKHGRFCSENCRKAGYRQRATKARKPKEQELILVATTCEHCGASFFAEAGKGAKYCSASHRTAAYRQRREAAIQTLIDLGINVEKARDVLELSGMRKTSRHLCQLGYLYDERSRRWVIPFETNQRITPRNSIPGSARARQTVKGQGSSRILP